MKNHQFRIDLITRHGKVQSFRKKGEVWEQTSSRGIKRKATAEQVLNHLLPALAMNKPKRAAVEVRFFKGKVPKPKNKDKTLW